METCKEYENIKYRTMLNKGTNIEVTNTESENRINDFLNQESKTNRLESWSKLSKTQKVNHIINYIELISDKYELTQKEKETSILFFTSLLNKKKLNKTTDIEYDKEKRSIISIHNLSFNTNTRGFVIKKEVEKNKTKKNITNILN